MIKNGLVVPGEQLARAWGLTRQALAPASVRGDVFAVKIGNRLYYPRSFLDLDRESVATVCRALGDVGPGEKLMFWLREHGALAGYSVAAALEAGVAVAKVERLAIAWARERGSRACRCGCLSLESFEDRLRPIRVEVASLVRLSRRPATEPYWSAGVYRFDDLESVIHETGRFVAGSYEVPLAELTERSVVRFLCDRRTTLVLADLTGAALKSMGLNNDISGSSDYAATQAWAAQAIHDASPRWDGIRYVSRQMNKGFAYAILERGGLLKRRAEKLKDPQVDELCDRFNVTAV